MLHSHFLFHKIIDAVPLPSSPSRISLDPTIPLLYPSLHLHPHVPTPPLALSLSTVEANGGGGYLEVYSVSI